MRSRIPVQSLICFQALLSVHKEHLWELHIQCISRNYYAATPGHTMHFPVWSCRRKCDDGSLSLAPDRRFGFLMATFPPYKTVLLESPTGKGPARIQSGMDWGCQSSQKNTLPNNHVVLWVRSVGPNMIQPGHITFLNGLGPFAPYF
jgi:hypothetical protein